MLSLLCYGYLQRARCALRRFALSAARFAAATVLRFLRVLLVLVCGASRMSTPEGIEKFWRGNSMIPAPASAKDRAAEKEEKKGDRIIGLCAYLVVEKVMRLKLRRTAITSDLQYSATSAIFPSFT
jgi:hypothetical protein